MKRIHIVPYKMGSMSAKRLKESLVESSIKAYRKINNRDIPKRKTLVVYYGGSEVLPEGGIQLNRNRSIAANKLLSFQAFAEHNISCVPWTADREEALKWYFANECFLARTSLSGHSGQGIRLYEPQSEEWEKYVGNIVQAPLYTKYVKKQMECRIHVFNGKVIDAQVKRKRADLPEGQEVNTKIRNHHTGWVYCREDFTPDQRCLDLAIAAVAAVKLDFGAVDIIYNGYHDQYYVLEVNTAPGLEGTTLQKYTQEFINVYQNN